jgi:hypothetical protein
LFHHTDELARCRQAAQAVGAADRAVVHITHLRGRNAIALKTLNKSFPLCQRQFLAR